MELSSITDQLTQSFSYNPLKLALLEGPNSHSAHWEKPDFKVLRKQNLIQGNNIEYIKCWILLVIERAETNIIKNNLKKRIHLKKFSK